MSDTIITAIITGGLSLVGVVFSNMAASKKTEQRIAVSQAVTDTKIDELTREVREHNGFAKRLPVLEYKVEDLYKRLDDGK